MHNKRSNSNSYFRIFTLQSPLCYPHHSGPKGLIQQTLYFLSSNKSPLYHHAPLEIHSIKQPLFTDAVSHSQHSNPHCNSMWRLLQFDYFLKFDTTRTPLVRATLFSSAFPIIPTHLIISCVLDNCLFQSSTSIVATAQFQDYYADKIPQASPDCGSPFRDGPTKWGGAGSWIVAVQMKNKHLRFFVCCHRSSLCHWSEVGEGGKPTPVTGFNGSTDLTSFSGG